MPACLLACRGNPNLRPILGVAWDCGAVTTGPVTVPILIALGVSVMKVQRAKQEAFEAVEEAAVNTNKGEC
jgi:phosphomannomutase